MVKAPAIHQFPGRRVTNPHSHQSEAVASADDHSDDENVASFLLIWPSLNGESMNRSVDEAFLMLFISGSADTKHLPIRTRRMLQMPISNRC